MQLARVTRRFDGVHSSLTKIVASIEKEFAAPISSETSNSVSAEIRAHVKGLTSEKRITFVQQAIKDSDQRAAVAVLGGPAFLSGIDTDLQRTWTHLFHEHHQPGQAKRLKAAKGALDLLGRSAGLVFGQVEKAVGASPHKVAKLRAAKTHAEAAFILRDN